MSIFDSDRITVKGKKQAAEHIIARYSDFGWTLTERKDDRLYSDVTYLSFTRPHFIENKDELQLLQVRLEIAFNNSGKLARKSRTRATFLADVFALFSILFAVGGVFLIISGGVLPLVFGSLLCALGVLTGVVGSLVSYRIYKKNKKICSSLIKAEAAKIDELCDRARRLRGVND